MLGLTGLLLERCRGSHLGVVRVNGCLLQRLGYLQGEVSDGVRVIAELQRFVGLDPFAIAEIDLMIDRERKTVVVRTSMTTSVLELSGPFNFHSDRTSSIRAMNLVEQENDQRPSHRTRSTFPNPTPWCNPRFRIYPRLEGHARP